jgi:hypothetical protein
LFIFVNHCYPPLSPLIRSAEATQKWPRFFSSSQPLESVTDIKLNLVRLCYQNLLSLITQRDYAIEGFFALNAEVVRRKMSSLKTRPHFYARHFIGSFLSNLFVKG